MTNLIAGEIRPQPPATNLLYGLGEPRTCLRKRKRGSRMSFPTTNATSKRPAGRSGSGGPPILCLAPKEYSPFLAGVSCMLGEKAVDAYRAAVLEKFNLSLPLSDNPVNVV